MDKGGLNPNEAAGSAEPYPYPKRGPGKKPRKRDLLIGFCPLHLPLMREAARRMGMPFAEFVRMGTLLLTSDVFSGGKRAKAQREEELEAELMREAELSGSEEQTPSS